MVDVMLEIWDGLSPNIGLPAFKVHVLQVALNFELD